MENLYSSRERAERLALPHVSDFYQFMTQVRNFSVNTAEAYTQAVKLFFRFMSSHSRDWQRAEYTDMFDFVMDCHEQDYARASMNLFINGVVAYYAFLEHVVGLPHSTVDLISRPSLPEVLPDVLTCDEVDAIIAQVPEDTFEGIRDRAIFAFLFATGVRVSELTNLKVSDLFLQDHVARVFGKGSRERFVIFDDATADALQTWLEVREDIDLPEEYQDYVFISQRLGMPIGRNLIFKKTKWYAAQAGITKNVHPHSFRHSFATSLLKGGMDVFNIKKLLGHASINSTMLYLHMDTEYLRTQVIEHHPRNILWRQRHAI